MALGVSQELSDKSGVGPRIQGGDVHLMIGVLPGTETLLTEDNVSEITESLTSTAVAGGQMTISNITPANIENVKRGDRIIVENIPSMTDGLFADVISVSPDANDAAKRQVKLTNLRNIYGVRIADGTAGTIDTDLKVAFVSFLAMPREVSSNLSWEHSTSTVSEKAPFGDQRDVVPLEQEDISARRWTVTMQVTQATAANAMMDTLIQHALEKKKPAICVRMVKNEDFRGYAGVVDVRPDSDPSDAGTEGAVQASFTLAGKSYLFTASDIPDA